MRAESVFVASGFVASSAARPGVSTSLGYAQPTTTPWGLSSARSVSASPRTANLAGDVRRVADPGDDPGGRRHQHEVARAPFDHPRQHGDDREQRPEVVQLHLLGEHLGRELLEAPGVSATGGRDEHVDRPELGDDQPERDLDRLAIGDVGRLGTDPRRVTRSGLQLVLGHGQALRVAGDERDAGTSSERAAAVANPMPLEPPVMSTWASSRRVMAPHARMVPDGTVASCVGLPSCSRSPRFSRRRPGRSEPSAPSRPPAPRPRRSPPAAAWSRSR